MRLFVGLAVDEAVKETLERLTLRLRAKDDGLRWSTPDQWHVTLRFLGNMASADPVVAALEAAVPPGQVAGDRYDAAQMAALDSERT